MDAIAPTTALERSTALLEALCAISSPSGDATGLRRCAERLGRELEPFGFAFEIEDEATAAGEPQPLLVARRPTTGGGRLLAVGHLDTVLPAITPTRLGDRLHGTGALDMKGGFAALVGALQTLAERGADPPPDLVVLAVPDEEVGGPISEAAMRRFGDGARAVLVLEPGLPRGDGESLVVGRRGLSVWRLEARGRAAHSGLAFAEGRSALAAAAGWAAEVQGLSETGAGPIVNAGRIVGGDSEFVQDLGEEHRFVGTSQRLNVVADRCIVEGEARYLTLSDRDRVLDAMRDHVAAAAARWQVELHFEVVDEILPVPPSSAGAGLAATLVEAAAADGWTLELETDRGGVSFPNFLPDPSAVPVIDGLGPVGCGMHTRDEYVSLRSLERRIHLIAQALVMLA
ncbi:MAG: M20/M25/M40 family metallo-hydrolase [Thermoanaerobaculales bacterium]|jgi:glutamate carboxypeptidase|nr:M20/M25/M40 family metallo-hydrolase [Thermoanaerobaculales bacterium]